MATKPRKPLAERLKLGLQEALAHAKGELTLKTTVLPEAPPEIDGPQLVLPTGRHERDALDSGQP